MMIVPYAAAVVIIKKRIVPFVKNISSIRKEVATWDFGVL